jgi:hypothetical protein
MLRQKIIFLLFVTLLSCSRVEKNPPIKIDVWYGHQQTFGRLGQPQKWINILGHIGSDDSLVAVYAVINHQDTMQLSLGPDCCRLARPGDFNIDIARDQLRAGKNVVQIYAESFFGEREERSVTVFLQRGTNWPLPYNIHWSEVENISDVVEIMDGKWELTEQGVRTVEPYYDRVLTFGDSTWSDYEISTTVIFHEFTPPAPGPPTYDVSHAAIASRFPGHDVDEFQPNRKWFPVGATSEFRLTADLDSCRWRIFDGENFYAEDKSPEKLRTIELGTVYAMKHRVESLPDGRTQYSVKLWPQDHAEPHAWDLIAFEPPGNLPNGAALLIAHNTDVTFGDVTAVAIE